MGTLQAKRKGKSWKPRALSKSHTPSRESEGGPTPLYPPALHFNQETTRILSNEVLELEAKGAISRVQEDGMGFVSPLFLVPKPHGTWRPVINLKSLNRYVVAHHYFKMETIRTVKGLIKPGDWLLKLDLKDAYLTVPIHQNHRKYLCFHWHGQTWQFQVLPFGLNSAPCTITKLTKPIVSILRRLGVRVIIYLDDMLLMAECPGSQCSLEGSSGDPSGTGVCRQLEEERIPAISETGVPWVCHQLQGNGDITTPPETSVSSVTGEKDPKTGKGDNPSVGPTPGDDDSSPPSNPPCSPALSTPGEDQDSSSSAGSHVYLNECTLKCRTLGATRV